LTTEHFMSRPILETTLLRTIGRQFTSRTTMDPHLEAVLGLTKNGTSIMSDIRFGIAQRLLKWQPFLLQQWRGQCIIIHMRMIIIGHDRWWQRSGCGRTVISRVNVQIDVRLPCWMLCYTRAIRAGFQKTHPVAVVAIHSLDDWE